MPRVVTTAQVLAARGAATRRTLRLDRIAGLWVGIEPHRTSRGPSTEGVPLMWPTAALRRARQIAKARAAGLRRHEIRERLLALGELPRR